MRGSGFDGGRCGDRTRDLLRVNPVSQPPTTADDSGSTTSEAPPTPADDREPLQTGPVNSSVNSSDHGDRDDED